MRVNVLFRRVRASLSQKWMVPSDPKDNEFIQLIIYLLKIERHKPQVEKVPWTGWNEMSLTA